MYVPLWYDSMATDLKIPRREKQNTWYNNQTRPTKYTLQKCINHLFRKSNMFRHMGPRQGYNVVQ